MGRPVSASLGVLYYYYHHVECWVGHRLHSLFVIQNSLNQRPVRTYYWGLRYKCTALSVSLVLYILDHSF
jgi:hypothetical protein